MKILNVRRHVGRQTIATFDLDIEQGSVRILNAYVKRNTAGALRAYAPTPADRKVVAFSDDFAEKIIAAMMAEIGGRSAYESAA